MKKMLICITLFICLSQAIAQNNVGINTTSPYAPLTFPSTQGSKIALYGTASNHYGFGVINNSLQVHTAGNGTGISFGSYSDSTFSEIMRIQRIGGRVGIGTNLPAAKLHVFGGTVGINPFSPSQLVLENNNFTYMNLLSPSSFESGILFGNETGNTRGGIIYGNSSNPDGFQFRNNGNAIKMVLDNQGRLGIGTITPGTTLHVLSGSSGGAPYASAQLTIENNNHTYLNLLSPNANETGVLFGKAGDAVSGSVIYNNFGNLNGLQFRTNGNQTRMVIDSVGRVGIGLTNPNAPLTFPPALGKKITLYPGATGDVGLAVQGNLLQIYSDNSNADIAFGYDQGGTVTERMRIKGNGNVGIGTDNPQFPLDVNGGIRLTGALNAGGSGGTDKQVLSSNGSSSSWKTLGSLIQTHYRYPTNMIAHEGTVNNANPFRIMTAISQTITVSTKSRLIITATFYGGVICPLGCTQAQSTIDILINGNEVVFGNFQGLLTFRVPGPGSAEDGIYNFFYDVNPGTYTIEFCTQSHTGSEFTLWSKYSTIIVLPID